MVAELVAIIIVALVAATELLHQKRVRRVARLAFGPSQRPRIWARSAPILRTIALGALVWGLTTLLLIAPKVHAEAKVDKSKLRHLVLLLDVSPSMRLEDAGPNKKQARAARAADLLESFFKRSGAQFKTSVVAFYTGAKPVVIDTTDMEIVRNILNDLPMHYAFNVGETDLFVGLEEVAKMAHPWNPNDATLIVLTDGDTVPPIGIPRLPASINHTLLVGVGDPRVGKFIDGRQSRQDVSTLRQVSIRLGGVYHNGNEKQISTDTLRLVSGQARTGKFLALSRREYALIACAAGGTIYAVLPLLLAVFGTAWRPGVPRAGTAANTEFGSRTTKNIDPRAVGAVS